MLNEINDIKDNGLKLIVIEQLARESEQGTDNILSDKEKITVFKIADNTIDFVHRVGAMTLFKVLDIIDTRIEISKTKYELVIWEYVADYVFNTIEEYKQQVIAIKTIENM